MIKVIMNNENDVKCSSHPSAKKKIKGETKIQKTNIHHSNDYCVFQAVKQRECVFLWVQKRTIFFLLLHISRYMLVNYRQRDKNRNDKIQSRLYLCFVNTLFFKQFVLNMKTEKKRKKSQGWNKLG